MKAQALRILRQGLTPRRFSATTAAGMTIGLHPIYGVTTVLCALIAQAFRLNHPWIQAANHAVAWLKPLLILPFLRFGERLFGAEPLPLSLAELAARFAEAPLNTLQTFSWSFLHATVGWLVCAPVIAGVVYSLTVRLLRRHGLYATATCGPNIPC